MINLIKDLLNFKVKKTDEEKNAYKVAIISVIFFQIGILFDLYRNKAANLHIYIILSFFITAVCFLLLISIRIYEFFIYINASYIWYVIRANDNLLAISKECLPECNPWRTMEIIKNKNNITEVVYPGEKILIPIKSSII